MLGDLIVALDRPDVTRGVLETMDPDVVARLEARAAAASMAIEDFTAGAVREFIDRADDDLWFQLLGVMRRTEDPGLAAVQTILGWVVTERPAPT